MLVIPLGWIASVRSSMDSIGLYYWASVFGEKEARNQFIPKSTMKNNE